MSRFLSWAAGALMVTALSAIALPKLYAMVFEPKIAPTHMFYSPVAETFIFREHAGNHDFSYLSAAGDSFDRREFETLLPFIYYKNMDLWGLLPIEIDGRSFDRETIRDARQVFELKAREIVDRQPGIPVYALLNADPGQAGLVFPTDVFRMEEGRMAFLNVDVNRSDPALTESFTGALTEAGFVFPARLVAGRQTILKPFDAGVFLIDATGAVFHLWRTGDTPHVVRTPIPTDLDIRHIKITENTKREILGLVLTRDDRLFLLSMPDYELIDLPVEGYVPDSMNYKLLLNPVQATAVYGDRSQIHAVAMTRDFAPFADYSRPMPGTTNTMQARIADALFPFTLSLGENNGPYLAWQVTWNGPVALIGIALSLVLFVALAVYRQASLRQALAPGLLVALTGPFGLLAAIAVPWPVWPWARRHRA